MDECSSRHARQERQRQKALRRLSELRAIASAEIERLIAFLDASDTYVTTELEDEHDGCEPSEDDEPSLCGITVDDWAGASTTIDGEQDDSDREPSLGWTIGGALGGHRDLEEECHDEGVMA